jgi:hypothetical protein
MMLRVAGRWTFNHRFGILPPGDKGKKAHQAPWMSVRERQ